MLLLAWSLRCFCLLFGCNEVALWFYSPPVTQQHESSMLLQPLYRRGVATFQTLVLDSFSTSANITEQKTTPLELPMPLDRVVGLSGPAVLQRPVPR